MYPVFTSQPGTNYWNQSKVPFVYGSRKTGEQRKIERQVKIHFQPLKTHPTGPVIGWPFFEGQGRLWAQWKIYRWKKGLKFAKPMKPQFQHCFSGFILKKLSKWAFRSVQWILFPFHLFDHLNLILSAMATFILTADLDLWTTDLDPWPLTNNLEPWPSTLTHDPWLPTLNLDQRPWPMNLDQQPWTLTNDLEPWPMTLAHEPWPTTLNLDPWLPTLTHDPWLPTLNLDQIPWTLTNNLESWPTTLTLHPTTLNLFLVPVKKVQPKVD